MIAFIVESNLLFPTLIISSEEVLLLLTASVAKSHHETKWMFHHLSES